MLGLDWPAVAAKRVVVVYRKSFSFRKFLMFYPRFYMVCTIVVWAQVVVL